MKIRVRNQDDLITITQRLNYACKIKLGKTYDHKPLPYWEGMPKFNQVKKDPYALIEFDKGNLSQDELSKLFEQPVTLKTKSIWYPKLEKKPRPPWFSHSDVKPRYPIYIISKGRPKCMTARTLDRMGVDYRIVIEPVDIMSYVEHNDSSKLIVTPFFNLGKGSIPVRNFVWDHACGLGFDWHWIMDDNIEDFNILYDNTKNPCRTGAIFRYAEDYTLLHDNVGQSGLNYYSFCKATDPVPPFYKNTRIYSCIFIRNDIPHRWRGKYNEDTDLSLRILKSGMCTILFNMFLAGKVTTQRMKGGNTDHVYTDGDNRFKFADSLTKQHPDVCKVVWKFNRWHHLVNYKGFTQELNRVREPDFDYTGDLYV